MVKKKAKKKNKGRKKLTWNEWWLILSHFYASFLLGVVKVFFVCTVVEKVSILPTPQKTIKHLMTHLSL